MQGIKFDGDKVEHSLLPKGTLKQVLNVLGYGKRKYTQNLPISFEQFKEIIEGDLWLKSQNALDAKRLKVFVQKDYVQPVIEKQLTLKLNVPLVESSEAFRQKLVNADHVMNESVLKQDLMNLLTNELTKRLPTT